MSRVRLKASAAAVSRMGLKETRGKYGALQDSQRSVQAGKTKAYDLARLSLVRRLRSKGCQNLNYLHPPFPQRVEVNETHVKSDWVLHCSRPPGVGCRACQRTAEAGGCQGSWLPCGAHGRASWGAGGVDVQPSDPVDVVCLHRGPPGLYHQGQPPGEWNSRRS